MKRAVEHAPKEITFKNKIGRKYIAFDNSFYNDLLKNNGPYQVKNLKYLRSLAPNAHTIIDVGTNIGMNAIEYATWAEHVVGFEPTERVYWMAMQNVAEARANNKAKIKPWYKKEPATVKAKVELYQMALGAKAGTVKLCNYGGNSVYNNILVSGKEDARKKLHNYEEVEMRTLDSFKFKNVDIIKIDTEGFEFPVLQGAVKTIKKYKPIIQVETIPGHHKFGVTVDEIQSFIVKLGYRVTDNQGKSLPSKKWVPLRKKHDRFFIPE
jgi:FkbM family methyltransferase